MFTGIVESTGKILRIEKNFFTISHHFAEKFSIGDSIAISGMCATILDFSSKNFTVEIMKISRDRTIFGAAKIGDEINLERPAKNSARNSGHFVLGHVDEVGKILARKKVADFENFKIAISPQNQKFIVEKGSIAVDGISFTISDLGKNFFEISAISHTLKITNLSEKKAGDGVNLEFDILGKYILRAENLPK